MPSFAALQTNVVERHYDRFGRPVGVSLNGERRTEITYDEATGRIASMRVVDADEQDSAVVEWWRVSSQSEDIGGQGRQRLSCHRLPEKCEMKRNA